MRAGARGAGGVRQTMSRLAALRVLVTLPLLLAGAGVCAAPGVPGPFTASFVLESSGATVGRTDWTLSRAGDGHLVYESRSETAGILALIRDDRILERSELRLRGSGALRPLAYLYDRTGKKKKHLEIDFDWGKGVAYNTIHGDTWPMQIPDGTLDKLSYLLALMRDLAAGREDVRYTIADGGKLKSYRLSVVAREQLETPIGTLDTVKVRRLRDDDAERSTVFWCATDLHYLPVRLEHSEPDGLAFSMEIDSLDGLGAPAAAQTADAGPRRATARAR